MNLYGATTARPGRARHALIAFVHREAEATGDLDYRAFLLKFPEALGLLDDE
jgi:hypothetical protein